MQTYHLTITQTGSILHAVVAGENTGANVDRYMTELEQAVEQYGCKNVLIEEKLTGPGIDTFEVFDIIRTHARFARIHDLRIAYVDLNNDHHRTTVAFGENLANILGVSVKVFSDVPSAAQWLNSEL